MQKHCWALLRFAPLSGRKPWRFWAAFSKAPSARTWPHGRWLWHAPWLNFHSFQGISMQIGLLNVTFYKLLSISLSSVTWVVCLVFLSSWRTSSSQRRGSWASELRPFTEANSVTFAAALEACLETAQGPIPQLSYQLHQSTSTLRTLKSLKKSLKSTAKRLLKDCLKVSALSLFSCLS